MAEERPAFSAEMTRSSALRLAAESLARAGIDEPLREARLLICAALNIAPAALIGDESAVLGASADRFRDFVHRRANREPFARIIGRREFYGHDFKLAAASLIPRPDTETLVDAVLDHLGTDRRAHEPLAIVDLGTGSGAILAALLHALPGATGLAIDLSPEALETAQNNIERIAGPGRAAFAVGNWFEGVTGTFDLIISNPPYIPSAEIAGLEPEVAQGEPALALDGGPDGLAAYRVIAAQSRPRLRPGGLVAVEIGAGQAGDVTAIFGSVGFALESASHDLGGHLRALLFRPR